MTLLRMFLVQTKMHFVWYFRRDGEMIFWTLVMPVFFLVLFSYAFFLHGFTGLAITAGCIVTLFVVMQMTARIRWAEQFRSPISSPVQGDR